MSYIAHLRRTMQWMAVSRSIGSHDPILARRCEVMAWRHYDDAAVKLGERIRANGVKVA